ncbi:MAG: hypothetical protein IT435_19715 [Phycisphaerales bacterium]|nr:hypothetical protein [Phycisphaerales bacterium]
MPLSTFAEWFIAILLLITGLSHIAQPRLWSQLFIDLLSKPYGGLWLGMLTFMIGAPLLIAHHHWGWDLRTIATVIAWGWTTKGTLYLLAPGIPPKIAARHIKHPSRFAYAGVVLVVLAIGLVVGIQRA